MQDDRFEWDDAKAESNRRKHGVSFDEARDTFDDPNAIDGIDDDPNELRWNCTGRAQSSILFVVYTDRARRIRIISARRASRHEQDNYLRQAHPYG